jgi:hypothetical protein
MALVDGEAVLQDVPQAGFTHKLVFSADLKILLIRAKYLCPDLMPVPAYGLHLTRPLKPSLCLPYVIVLLNKQRS